MERLDRRNRGCLTALGAWIALVALAPFSAAVRWWRRRRRGRRVWVEWTTGDSSRLQVVEVTVDAPVDRSGDVRREVTRAVVAVAARLAAAGEVVHQVVRLPWEDETRRLPVGPRLQDLGDRFSLALGHAPYARRTVLWLALAAEEPLHEAVGPGFDPEAPGEPVALVQAGAARWAVAAAAATVGPSAIVRLQLMVPRAAEAAVHDALERLRRQLAG